MTSPTQNEKRAVCSSSPRHNTIFNFVPSLHAYSAGCSSRDFWAILFLKFRGNQIAPATYPLEYELQMPHKRTQNVGKLSQNFLAVPLRMYLPKHVFNLPDLLLATQAALPHSSLHKSLRVLSGSKVHTKSGDDHFGIWTLSLHMFIMRKVRKKLVWRFLWSAYNHKKALMLLLTQT